MVKQIAIIAPTASGKTALSIQVAKKCNGIILSLDSLAVYKEVDIASAKPTKQEQSGVKHFGLDVLYVNQKFDVMKFFDLYKNAYNYAHENSKSLIIVGGTSFYLKALVEGLSSMPDIDRETSLWVKEKMNRLCDAYNYMYNIDNKYMNNISSNDSYRIEKALSIFKQTGMTPTQYFAHHTKQSLSHNIKLFEIVWEVSALRKRIEKRTHKMIEMGLIDEVIALEKKYTREPNAMGAIGIVETLEYLDGKLDKNQLHQSIVTHTARLAKRQRTFNKSQFSQNITRNSLEMLEKDIFKYFSI